MTDATTKTAGPRATDHDLSRLAEDMGLGVRIFFTEAMWKAIAPDEARFEFVDRDAARERKARAILLTLRRIVHQRARDYVVATVRSEGKARTLIAQMGYDAVGFWVRVMPDAFAVDEGVVDF